MRHKLCFKEIANRLGIVCRHQLRLGAQAGKGLTALWQDGAASHPGGPGLVHRVFGPSLELRKGQGLEHPHGGLGTCRGHQGQTQGRGDAKLGVSS